MLHPTVLSCAILVSKLGEQSAERDARFAASEAKISEIVACSRDAIERSHDLLRKLKTNGR